jgi:hypothetical protein
MNFFGDIGIENFHILCSTANILLPRGIVKNMSFKRIIE